MAEPYHGRRVAAAMIVHAALTVLVATGCGDKKPAPGRAEQPADAASPVVIQTPSPPSSRCVAMPFAETVSLAEASGVARLPDGLLLVVADSGHRGAYQIIDAKSGTLSRTGKLDVPFKRDGDDIEGLSSHGDSIVALLSGGLLAELEPRGAGFRLVRPPALIGKNPGCSRRAGNCGFNWEGICMGTISAPELDDCVGVAVSKRDGTLVCLRQTDDGRIALDTSKTLNVARGGTLSGCDISADGSIWVSSNILGANSLFAVGAGEPRRYQTFAPGSIEAVAVVARDDEATELVLFSDTNQAPSAVFRYRCDGPL